MNSIQVIPAEAVEAAVHSFTAAHEAARKAWMENPGAESPHLESNIRAALEAASPYMLAAAWEEGRLVGRAEEQSGFDTEMNPYGDPYMLNNEGEK